MIKTRILASAEYWEAYKRHKCTGRPVISVGVGEVKCAPVEKPKRTEWKRRSGDGMWIEIELED